MPCPLSRREIRARALVPRLATRIVCVDDGRGVAERLAGWLETIGASDVAVLDGGTPAWEAKGFQLFSGVNVPSKAFGEWVEHHFGTESVEPAELKSWLDEGRNMAVLDSRTFGEFRRMAIPTAVSVPGGELVYRVGDLVPDPATLIVVNCAGRTRSILGAESLRRAGVPNRVVALRNGTMGWELAGLVPERGRTERFAAGRPASTELALRRAKSFAEASGVGVIGPLDLTRFEADAERTCYVLDVRDPAEFKGGHRPGSLSAPGGQLVQATDGWIGVRNARIALVDDDGGAGADGGGVAAPDGSSGCVRGRGRVAGRDCAGHRTGWRAGTAGPGGDDRRRCIGGELGCGGGGPGAQPRIPQRPYSRGALWGVRTRLETLRGRLAGAELVVLTSPDSMLARLAVTEAAELTRAPVRVLEGGTAAWMRAGQPLESDRANPPDAACIDVFLRPYDRNCEIEAAMRDYLSWEIDLIGQIERDGTVAFGVPEGG